MFVKSRAETIKTDVEQQEGEDEELFPSAFGQRCGCTPRCSLAFGPCRERSLRLIQFAGHSAG